MVPLWASWVGACFVSLVLAAIIYWGLLLVRNLRNEPVLDQTADFSLPDDLPLVSVVVPAKDEEHFVESSLRSVLGSDYPRLQLVAVNDRSTDRTGEILAALAGADPRMAVVTIDKLPEGWTGKTHALFQGAAEAAGEVLLFTDADTTFQPDAITRALMSMRSNDLDILSLLPGFMTRGFNENVVNPHLQLGLCSIYQPRDVNDQGNRAGLASGSFIMIKREVYRSIGTWKRFRNEITEDLALSKAVKREGHRFMVVRASDLVKTRGFHNLSELRRFWKRAFYGGFERDVFTILRVTCNYLALTALTLCLIASGIASLTGRGSPAVHAMLAVSAVAMALLIGFYGFFVRKESGTWLYGLTAPLGVLVSAWVALSALVAAVSGKGINWRGSRYT